MLSKVPDVLVWSLYTDYSRSSRRSTTSLPVTSWRLHSISSAQHARPVFVTEEPVTQSLYGPMTFNYFARSAAWPCNQNLHTTLKDRLFMELFTLSSRSYLVAWIIATHCSIMVCPTTLSEEFSPSRTPLLGSHCRSRTTRSYLAGFAAVALASCPETCWLQTGMFWSGHAPPYLANDTLLVFEGPQRSSTLFHRQIVYRSTHTQHIRRQELRCRRATCLEQSSGPLSQRGRYIQQFQTWTQRNVFVLILLPRCNATCVNCAV